MENSLDEMERKRLLNAIKQVDEYILVEQKELDQIQSETNEQYAAYLALKTENEDLYKQIELEENTSVRYSKDRLDRHIDMLQVDVEAVCASFQNIINDQVEAEKKDIELERIWHKLYQDWQNEWFNQSDDVLQQAILRMDHRLQSLKTDMCERREEFRRFMEQTQNEVMAYDKANRDVERLTFELKKIIITYQEAEYNINAAV